MHIEPGIVTGAKLVWSYATGIATGRIAAKLVVETIRERGSLSFALQAITKANCRKGVRGMAGCGQRCSLVAEHRGRGWTRGAPCAADTGGVIRRTSLPMQH
ncbi:hypothetical protein ACVW0I_001297 [Bradyrhizobium sp. LM6.11]